MNPCWWYHWLNMCDSLNGYIRIFLFLLNSQRVNSTATIRRKRRRKKICASICSDTKNLHQSKRNSKHTDEMNRRMLSDKYFSWFSWQIIIKYCLWPTSIWILVTFMDYYRECFCHCVVAVVIVVVASFVCKCFCAWTEDGSESENEMCVGENRLTLSILWIFRVS